MYVEGKIEPLNRWAWTKRLLHILAEALLPRISVQETHPSLQDTAHIQWLKNNLDHLIIIDTASIKYK